MKVTLKKDYDNYIRNRVDVVEVEKTMFTSESKKRKEEKKFRMED